MPGVAYLTSVSNKISFENKPTTVPGSSVFSVFSSFECEITYFDALNKSYPSFTVYLLERQSFLNLAVNDSSLTNTRSLL